MASESATMKKIAANNRYISSYVEPIISVGGVAAVKENLTDCQMIAPRAFYGAGVYYLLFLYIINIHFIFVRVFIYIFCSNQSRSANGEKNITKKVS